jgi:hypothetical protein
MTPAEKRMQELLDRWIASIELHARYLKLDDAAYAKAEAWPKHQRPTSWIVDLARKRLLDLKYQLEQRQGAGDAAFSESLELMSFLTSLLGSEHIERFIPLATGKPPDTGISATVEQPRTRPAPKTAPQRGLPPATSAPAGTPKSRTTGTHKALAAGAKRETKPAPSKSPPAVPAAEKAPAPRPSPASGHSLQSVVTESPASAPPADAVARQVIADAARMLEWGREWPSLAGLIARMADRPPEAEIWKILRAYRSEIMAKARRSDV